MSDVKCELEVEFERLLSFSTPSKQNLSHNEDALSISQAEDKFLDGQGDVDKTSANPLCEVYHSIPISICSAQKIENEIEEVLREGLNWQRDRDNGIDETMDTKVLKKFDLADIRNNSESDINEEAFKNEMVFKIINDTIGLVISRAGSHTRDMSHLQMQVLSDTPIERCNGYYDLLKASDPVKKQSSLDSESDGDEELITVKLAN